LLGLKATAERYASGCALEIERGWVGYAAAGLRRLRTKSTESPRIIPAAIDSHGKPGTAGTTSGVVALDDEDAVTVTILTEPEVLVELLVSSLVVELDVWVVELVTWAELVDVEPVVVELVEEEVLLELVLLVVVTTIGTVVVAIWAGGFSGSRWNSPETSDPPTGVPTANPSSGPVR
jgi:hypothetical protein